MARQDIDRTGQDDLNRLLAAVDDNFTELYDGFHPGYTPGQWYACTESAATNAAVPAVDTLYLFPFALPRKVTVTAFLLRTVTGGAASAAKAGLWRNSPLSMRPVGVPILADNNGQATTATGVPVLSGMAGDLPAGLYWFGSKFTGTLPTMQCVSEGPVMSKLIGVPKGVAIFPTLLVGISIADAYANNIAATNLAEGAAFANVTTTGVPNAGFQT